VTAPATRVNFVADPVVIIKNKILDDFIVLNAIDTPDPTPIAPPWARCSFLISAGHRCSNQRLALATLREAMQHAIAYNLIHELKITIGIQALHFRPGLNYLYNGELILQIQQLVLVQHRFQRLLQPQPLLHLQQLPTLRQQL